MIDSKRITDDYYEKIVGYITKDIDLLKNQLLSIAEFNCRGVNQSGRVLKPLVVATAGPDSALLLHSLPVDSGILTFRWLGFRFSAG